MLFQTKIIPALKQNTIFQNNSALTLKSHYHIHFATYPAITFIIHDSENVLHNKDR